MDFITNKVNQDLSLLYRDNTRGIKCSSLESYKGTIYELSKILETEQITNTEEFNLFTFDDDINQGVRDSLDKPIKEYPLVDYREVVKYE